MVKVDINGHRNGIFMSTQPSTEELPKARVRARPRFSPIWLVPLVAGIAAVWLVGMELRERGPLITISFVNGNGLQANQTVLKYHGVRVGEVQSIQLSGDLQQVAVRVRLQRSAAGLAREGSRFWIVRPEVSSGGLHGLETIVSGPFIQGEPGKGKIQKIFTGDELPPVNATQNGRFEVIVTTPQINTLTIGSPVYYRGVEVGSVSYFILNDNAQLINIHLLIETNFAPLVRMDSKFWNAGGISFRLKLLGVNISAENIKSLIIGGIAFATPDNPGPQAAPGTVFPLNERVQNDWLKWSPAIAITNSRPGPPGQGTPPTMLVGGEDGEDGAGQ
jgi:paraquat-inducible protein B